MRGRLAQSKKSLSEKTEVVKKGGGGGLSFLTKSKKKTVFTPPLIGPDEPSNVMNSPQP